MSALDDRPGQRGRETFVSCAARYEWRAFVDGLAHLYPTDQLTSMWPPLLTPLFARLSRISYEYGDIVLRLQLEPKDPVCLTCSPARDVSTGPARPRCGPGSRPSKNFFRQVKS